MISKPSGRQSFALASFLAAHASTDLLRLSFLSFLTVYEVPWLPPLPKSTASNLHCCFFKIAPRIISHLRHCCCSSGVDTYLSRHARDIAPLVSKDLSRHSDMAISVPPLSDSESEDGMQVHSDHANLESESHEAQSAAMEGPSPPVCSQTLQLLSNTCDALNSQREEMEPVVQGLCEQLRSLRSVVPHSSPNSCVIRDALEYREELKRQIQGLQSGVVLGSTEQQAPEARSTQVEVLANGDQIEIHVLCEKKPGLVVALMETIEEFGLVFEVANMSCRNRVALDVYGKQGKEGFTEAEEIKKALLHTITERLNDG